MSLTDFAAVCKLWVSLDITGMHTKKANSEKIFLPTYVWYCMKETANVKSQQQSYFSTLSLSSQPVIVYPSAEAHHRDSRIWLSKKRTILLGRRDRISFIASLSTHTLTQKQRGYLGASCISLLRSHSAESLKKSDANRKSSSFLNELSLTF